MSFRQRHVLPDLLDFAMRQNFLVPFRNGVIGAAKGRVLEIGIGSGLNFPLYGATVTSVIGLEPSPELLRMAHPRASTAAVPVTLLDGVGALGGLKRMVGCPPIPLSWPSRCRTSTTPIAVTTSPRCCSKCRTGRRIKREHEEPWGRTERDPDCGSHGGQ